MAMTLITNSADTDSTDLTNISFTSGIDSTYKLYIFKFIDINPATDEADFAVQFNAASGSGFNETITSTFFHVFHDEADVGGQADLGYHTGHDQAQGTAYQHIGYDMGNSADESVAGTLWLFNPSNTTYVKHFYSQVCGDASVESASYSKIWFASGYINTTSAIDEVDFKMISGNFDGTIKMYGVG